MRTVPERVMRRPMARKLLITLASEEFSCAGLVSMSGPVSAAWASANDPIAVPFRLSEAAVVDRLGWMNGSAAGGNVDVGIYRASDLALMVSTGSTLGSGNSVWQFVDVAATALAGGTHFLLVMSRDNTTANRARMHGVGGTAGAVALAGCLDSATNAFPLPDPITNLAAAATFVSVPVMCIAFRAPF